MGSFYVNVTLLDGAADVVAEVAPRPSFVGPFGSDVVVFAAADDQAGGPMVGAELTGALGCTGISVGVHDDDVVFWEVHRAGETQAAGAVPDPVAAFGLGPEEMADMAEMVGDMGEMAEMTGDMAAAGEGVATGEGGEGDGDGGGDPAAELVTTLGRGDLAAVRAALAADHAFATDRHAQLVGALGLPTATVSWGDDGIEAVGADDDLVPAVEHLA